MTSSQNSSYFDNEGLLESQKPKRILSDYMHITNEQRELLVQMVIYNDMPLSKACQQLNIKYTTGRSIVKVYKNNGRVYRCGTQSKF
jgi:hypothetical protein